MDKVSYVGNADLNAIDHLYKQYQKDPNSIDSGWVKFLRALNLHKLIMKTVAKFQKIFKRIQSYTTD